MYRLGLIGYPIQHSLSPWIHNHFLKRAQLQGTYELIEISPHDSFEHAIQQLKKRDLDGFNITVPYKQHIIPYLDEVDPAAKRVGAVNTVLLKDDKWIGYNTDGWRSEEHTSELQSRGQLVCRLLLEKKKIMMHNDLLI